MAQVLTVDSKSFGNSARQAGKRRSRPLTAAQERLFFVVAFGLAALLQITILWAY
jgi:hypothetical protein